MKIIKTFLKIVGGGIFLFLLWPMWEFWGVNIVRDMRCGPSESIPKPMAEAIVREINKREIPYEIIDLKQVLNLPYTLNCGEVYMNKKNLKPQGVKFNFKQTCHYSLEDTSYRVILEYGANNENNSAVIYLDESAHISITFSKVDILENDLTKLIYSASKPVINEGKWYYGEKLVLHETINKVYEKDSNDNCRYRTPLTF